MVAGIDYSETLVNMALSAMPGADLRLAEAIEIPTAAQFEVANGVFLYFPSYDYAKEFKSLIIPSVFIESPTCPDQKTPI